MKKLLFLLLVSGLTISCLAQQKVVINRHTVADKVAQQVPVSSTGSSLDIARYIHAQLPSDSERVRAAFMWVASNIQYDVSNMYAMNFYERKEEKVARALATRKGICEAYATLFQEICTNLGLTSYVVTGYTKQNGFADYIPHAWCAAQVNGSWLLYDPTWGSGYISNGKFVKKINEAYYAARPQSLLRSHMPFDYLWQCMYYPINNQEFYEGKTAEDKTKPYFSYPDSIKAYAGLKHTEQLSAAARRIEATGLKNSMIFDRLHHVKAELEHERESAKVDLYNDAVFDYNDGVRRLNDFIEYRNAQFSPAKHDAEIQGMLTEAAKRINGARTKLKAIEQPNSRDAALILQMMKNLDEVDGKVLEMQEWLTKYFSKSKVGRKSMFYKVSWMGIPLN